MMNSVFLIHLAIMTGDIILIVSICTASTASLEDDNELLSHANREALCKAAFLALFPIGKLDRARLVQLAL